MNRTDVRLDGAPGLPAGREAVVGSAGRWRRRQRPAEPTTAARPAGRPGARRWSARPAVGGAANGASG
ncbi:hypothetical protein AAFH96_11685 [Polymorphospora sp. 2-325]|uniref:Uncharacterized protein n=1 Tax=Polymorphospora lycopeni TaxID=3140240 RepID=A0ABV5CPC0_9ACTN